MLGLATAVWGDWALVLLLCVSTASGQSSAVTSAADGGENVHECVNVEITRECVWIVIMCDSLYNDSCDLIDPQRCKGKWARTKSVFTLTNPAWSAAGTATRSWRLTVRLAATV
jgi:hypothetical protein